MTKQFVFVGSDVRRIKEARFPQARQRTATVTFVSALHLCERVKVMDLDEAFAVVSVELREVEATDHVRQAMLPDARRRAAALLAERMTTAGIRL